MPFCFPAFERRPPTRLHVLPIVKTSLAHDRSFRPTSVPQLSDRSSSGLMTGYLLAWLGSGPAHLPHRAPCDERDENR
jgi:hypothetical protein